MSSAWKDLERSVAREIGGHRILRGGDFSVSSPDIIKPVGKYCLVIDCKYRSSPFLPKMVMIKKLCISEGRTLYFQDDKSIYIIVDTSSLVSLVYRLSSGVRTRVHIFLSSILKDLKIDLADIKNPKRVIDALDKCREEYSNISSYSALLSKDILDQVEGLKPIPVVVTKERGMRGSLAIFSLGDMTT